MTVASQTSFDQIALVDAEILPAMQAEVRRQQETIELIASENQVSRAVLEALGSVFTNKYAEGYSAKRYNGGCQNMDAVENMAQERCKKLFGCDHANVQPHFGSQANAAVYLAVLQPGLTIEVGTIAGDMHVGNHDASVNVVAKKGSSATIGDHNLQSGEYSEGAGPSPDIVAELAKLRETIASMGLDDEARESIDCMLDNASSEASAETPKRSMVSTYVGGALNAVKAINAGVKFVENRAALEAAIAGIVIWCGSYAEPILSVFR